MYTLVTGGAGFIGSHLVESLISEMQKVIVIDNFNDYYNPELKESNISHILDFLSKKGLDSSYFQLIRGDIRDKALVNRVTSQYQIGLVVHLAAMAGVRPSIQMPEYYYDVNINGTLNLLESCRKNNIKKFIFASSSSVYGNNKKVPFTESDFVDMPISPYAASKKAGELLCYTYHHLYNMSIACLRFFTVYGPRQRPDLAIHKFTDLIINDKELPFYGDGTTKRDYTYIDDIIDGISKAIIWIGGEAKYDIFNLGESRTISLNEMVNAIEEALGKKAKLNRLSLQAGDVERTFADITKAKSVINYSPSVSFKEGINRFIRWKIDTNKKISYSYEAPSTKEESK